MFVICGLCYVEVGSHILRVSNLSLLTLTDVICVFQFCHISMYFIFILKIFIYLFLAALGLHCCVQAFSSCSERGLLFVAVPGLLIAVASLVAEHRL